MKKEILENIVLIIGIIIAYIAKEGLLFVKNEYKKWLKPKWLLKSITVNKEIYVTLKHILRITNADRVHILSYHNGTVDFNGISFDYASMTHEAVAENIEPLSNMFQNIPISQFADLLSRIHTYGMQYIPKDDESIMGKYHRAYGIECAYKYRIGNSIANGSLSISFNKKEVELS